MGVDDVRTLERHELADAARVVAHGMLGPVRDDVATAWVEWMTGRTHGSFAPDGTLAGTARWFPAELAMPGDRRVGAAAVTGVAVLPTHRRQGRLRRLMAAQLEDVRAAGLPVAVLVAAEWSIYGRYGYGPAVPACGWHVDAARVHVPARPEGSVALTTGAEVRADIERVHDGQLRRAAGSITRDGRHWDALCGLVSWPGRPEPTGKERFAVWRDEHGRVLGVVGYEVAEKWEFNQPRGTATVQFLYGATPTAERELWRHLCSLDWVSTIEAVPRGLDDPLPLWLDDGRAARAFDPSDHVWLRILDVPAAVGARAAGADGEVTVEVIDPDGPAAGRFLVTGSGGVLHAAPVERRPAVTLGVGALASLLLGGMSVGPLAAAGLVEGEPDAVAGLAALLATTQRPWCTTDF